VAEHCFSVPLDTTLTIILGGGKGTRLYPLTMARCKPAVPLGGKYRLIDIPISNSLNSGLRNIYILTQFMSSSLNRHVSRTYQMDTFSKGFVSLLAATQTHRGVEDWFQGTADAVRKCLSMANIHRYKRVVILSGDQLYKMDYREMLQTHEQQGGQITVGVLPVEREKVPGFGIMRIGKDGLIREFVEKPKDPAVIDGLQLDSESTRRYGLTGSRQNWLASMGIYVFETPVLVEMLADEGRNDFGKDIIPSALSGCKTVAHLFEGYWEDIGTIKAFFEANLKLGSDHPPFDFYGRESEKIYTRQRFLTASHFSRAHVAASVISDGCYFGPDVSVTRSVIGVRSRIGENTVIEDTVTMGADYYERPPGEEHLPPVGIGRNVTVRRAILDKNVVIGDGSRIENERNVEKEDGKNYFIRDGIVIIPRTAVIPPGTVI
jgi:glucose-1-phosphate adenylyltransferase